METLAEPLSCGVLDFLDALGNDAALVVTIFLFLRRRGGWLREHPDEEQP